MFSLITDILNQFHWTLSTENSKYFLTEEDLRCRLFLELETSKKNLDISINSEIRWFWEDRTLKYRSDIVIIPSSSIDEDLEKWSIYMQKWFTFLDYIWVIELKLRRKNIKKSDKEFLKEIEKDCQKLIELRQKTTNSDNSNTKLYSVFVLDKKANLVTEMNNLRQKYKFINIYYFSFLLTE